MTTPTNHTPPEVRRCYLCGRNMNLPSTADSFLLQVLKNGRSYNYCSYHWQLLRKYAPAEKIEEHRRNNLHEEDLKNNIRYSKLKKIISELKNMTN
jgi:hypothetical protein